MIFKSAFIVLPGVLVERGAVVVGCFGRVGSIRKSGQVDAGHGHGIPAGRLPDAPSAFPLE